MIEDSMTLVGVGNDLTRSIVGKRSTETSILWKTWGGLTVVIMNKWKQRVDTNIVPWGTPGFMRNCWGITSSIQEERWNTKEGAGGARTKTILTANFRRYYWYPPKPSEFLGSYPDAVDQGREMTDGTSSARWLEKSSTSAGFEPMYANNPRTYTTVGYKVILKGIRQSYASINVHGFIVWSSSQAMATWPYLIPCTNVIWVDGQEYEKYPEVANAMAVIQNFIVHYHHQELENIPSTLFFKRTTVWRHAVFLGQSKPMWFKLSQAETKKTRNNTNILTNRSQIHFKIVELKTDFIPTPLWWIDREERNQMLDG